MLKVHRTGSLSVTNTRNNGLGSVACAGQKPPQRKCQLGLSMLRPTGAKGLWFGLMSSEEQSFLANCKVSYQYLSSLSIHR